MIQSVIDAYIAIKDPLQRKLAMDSLRSLQESKELETELNDEIEQNVSWFNENGGDRSHKSSHYLVTGDIRSEDVVLKIKNKINQVDLVFTSPPYNASIAYDTWNDNLPIEQYKSFIESFITSCDTVLSDGGRFVINIRDISVATGVRVPAIVILYRVLCEKLGYKYRGVHIWYKGREESSFAWGSYKSSKNPAIIDLFEYVYVFQKPGARAEGEDDIEKTDFIENVMGVWKIRPVKKIVGSDKKNTAKHPCPFPPELARRVIKLYSKCGDTVLDPFAGVGSTAVGAVLSGRNSVSVDISNDYINEADCRLKREFKDLWQWDGSIKIARL